MESGISNMVLSFTGDFSSPIVTADDNFSHLKARKPELIDESNSYDLCPLPDLLSLEPPPRPIIITDDLFTAIESSNKRFRYSPPAAVARPASEIARKRRRNVSDRIKVLGSLMPWETKMSMGKLLEEALKYIKFLEAQVTALQRMPVESGWSGSGPWMGLVGGLELLSRQQLLEVTVKSAAVQSLLYEKGYCVFSAEQVAGMGEMVMVLPAGSDAHST